MSSIIMDRSTKLTLELLLFKDLPIRSIAFSISVDMGFNAIALPFKHDCIKLKMFWPMHQSRYLH